MLRDAAATGDVREFEKVFTQVIAAKKGFWERLWMRIQLHVAICSNYDKIIGVADSIINDPNASASDKEWAQGKRDEAVAGKEKQGCSTTVS
ncbi:hypothetical protein CLG96_06400 [Sphingomonas oleivorans]|uniref:Uncharacterized protein n=2 Tax=Sphingomonas oleivorans TaxID=1735121 RepID=A0A2T5FZP9_9SPHN|nr:hypothetical protein CLG96_06400 [Sphingomonas oleivorans]